MHLFLRESNVPDGILDKLSVFSSFIVDFEVSTDGLYWKEIDFQGDQSLDLTVMVNILRFHAMMNGIGCFAYNVPMSMRRMSFSSVLTVVDVFGA